MLEMINAVAGQCASVLSWIAGLLAVYLTYIFFHTRSTTELARKLYGPSAKLVTGNDQMWRMDSLYNNMNVNSIYVLHGSVTAADIIKLYETVVLNDEMNHRLKQRFVTLNGLSFWVDDKEFDVNNHIVDMDPRYSPNNMEGLLKTLSHVYSVTLPMDRPLWKLVVISNFNGGSQTAIFSSFHHVIADGVALVTMWLRQLERIDETGPAPFSDKSTKKIMQKAPPASRMWQMLQIGILGPLMVLQVVLGKPDNNPMHRYGLSGRRRVGLSSLFNVADVKNIARHFGVTVNDTVMGILGAAINRYFTELGCSEKILHLYVPVNLRLSSKPPQLENKFSPSFAKLAVHTSDPSESIIVANGMFSQLKSSVNPMVMYMVATWLGSRFCPQWFGRFFLDFVANKTTAVITNMPGPQERMRFAGEILDQVMFWVPSRGSIGIGISILSYGGKLQVGLTADELCMKNPNDLLIKVDEVYEEVLRLVKASRTEPQGPVAEGNN